MSTNRRGFIKRGAVAAAAVVDVLQIPAFLCRQTAERNRPGLRVEAMAGAVQDTKRRSS